MASKVVMEEMPSGAPLIFATGGGNRMGLAEAPPGIAVGAGKACVIETPAVAKSECFMTFFLSGDFGNAVCSPELNLSLSARYQKYKCSDFQKFIHRKPQSLSLSTYRECEYLA